jgi:hypothetical protein
MDDGGFSFGSILIFGTAVFVIVVAILGNLFERRQRHKRRRTRPFAQGL